MIGSWVTITGLLAVRNYLKQNIDYLSAITAFQPLTIENVLPLCVAITVFPVVPTTDKGHKSPLCVAVIGFLVV